ncbi:alpha/beta fold hydrolase [Cryobacterium psychrophilum]|uniref:Alpha/beta hydrolase n=1 Tax=Cryobacterium psychrophilum TaxID=41988 RepID=A0A4Y8KWI4_9MICO|nr:alpha/beta hydrolase [Cryobacterium psychrophilum]TDW28685.1 alpha/beta hydrolase family protein [Cryobacterium psychrophilum]TFD82345.1 alpha/beta hydrolase [Cryobacterium psychrophilum]
MHTPPAPPPKIVHATDGTQLATYEFGDPDAPTVFLLHGFASSALANWHHTGWVRDLVRAGYHLIALDQRGHGASDKPLSAASFAMGTLVDDVLRVLDAYLINEVGFVGYSLGARVGWRAAHDHPDRISRAVLGGIPDGDPLKRFDIADARAHIEHGVDVTDRLTGAFLKMAKAVPGNNLTSLVALVEGMRDGEQPSAANAPLQPVMFATGSDDHILEASRALAAVTPQGTFFEIPGRNHFNAPTSRDFRDAARSFLAHAL